MWAVSLQDDCTGESVGLCGKESTREALRKRNKDATKAVQASTQTLQKHCKHCNDTTNIAMTLQTLQRHYNIATTLQTLQQPYKNCIQQSNNHHNDPTNAATLQTPQPYKHTANPTKTLQNGTHLPSASDEAKLDHNSSHRTGTREGAEQGQRSRQPDHPPTSLNLQQSASVCAIPLYHFA